MLLRASRSAEHLTKEAIFRQMGRFALGAGRGLVKSPAKNVGMSGKAGYGTGAFVRRNWKPLAGAGLTAAVAGPAVVQGLRKAKAGLDPRYIQAQKYGLAPQLRAG